jgi:hypothetical protein
MSIVRCEKNSSYYTDDSPVSDPKLIISACETIQGYCTEEKGECDVKNCKIEELRKKLAAKVSKT